MRPNDDIGKAIAAVLGEVEWLGPDCRCKPAVARQSSYSYGDDTYECVICKSRFTHGFGQHADSIITVG